MQNNSKIILLVLMFIIVFSFVGVEKMTNANCDNLSGNAQKTCLKDHIDLVLDPNNKYYRYHNENPRYGAGPVKTLNGKITHFENMITAFNAASNEGEKYCAGMTDNKPKIKCLEEKIKQTAATACSFGNDTYDEKSSQQPTNSLTINEGTVGFTSDNNNWPQYEAPLHAIDGKGQKYLNFGKENTGILVNPSSRSVPKSLIIYTANDADARDPASFILLGTNDIDPLASDAAYTEIASGDLTLPTGRNEGGIRLIDNSSIRFKVDFNHNSTAYTHYLLYFPTVKDSGRANSMQIAEVQLLDANSTNIFTTDSAIKGVKVSN